MAVVCAGPSPQGKRRASLHPSERLLGLTRRASTGSVASLRRARGAQEMFRPAISARARLLPSRSASELSEGGRLRRERTLVRAAPLLLLPRNPNEKP